MSYRAQDIQMASLLARGLSRPGLHVASAAALDGSGLFVASNRKRTNIWVEGMGHDAVHRSFRITTQRVGRRYKSVGSPFALSTFLYRENGRRVFRFNLSFSPHERHLGIGAAGFSGDHAHPAEHLYLGYDLSEAMTKGIITVRGTHRGLKLPDPLMETIDLNVESIAKVRSNFNAWIQAAFPEKLRRIEYFAPILYKAAARRYAQWVKQLLLAGVTETSRPVHVLDATAPFSPKSPDECSGATTFVMGCCDYQPSVALGIMCYVATSEAAVIDPIIAAIADDGVEANDDSGDDDGPDSSDDGPDDGSDDGDGPGSDGGGDPGEFGGGGCFVAGTLVSTPAGMAPIDRLVAGDQVWALDRATKKLAARKIVRVFKCEREELKVLNFVGDPIRCTPLHRFFAGAWTPAKQLAVTDRVLRSDGIWGTLESIHTETRTQPVFNLEVETDHNYFVGASGLLVHNRKDAEVDDDPGGDSGSDWPD